MDIEVLKNLVDYGVIALLIFMSFISFWFFIERVIATLADFRPSAHIEFTKLIVTSI